MKPFYIFFVSLVLFVLISLGYATYLPYMPYKADATVTEIEGEIITVETKHGNAYQFYGNGFYNGEEVTIYINTKGDKNVSNDEIVDVKIK